MAVGFSRNFFQAVFSNDSEVAPGFGETRVSSNSTFFGQNLDAFCWKVWVMGRHCYSAGAEGLRYKGPVINNLS